MYRDPRTGAWLLSRFEDVYAALADHETFSSENTRGADSRLGPRRSARVLVGQDQPGHTRIRRLVNRPLARGEIEKLEPELEALVGDLLDAATEQPVDLVPALAIPLPVIVIARVLGIAPEDYRRFRAWSDAVIASDAPAEATSSAVREMHALFREVAASRRADPRDDLISVLVHEDADGEPLSEEELLDICQVMLVSGNQTTTAPDQQPAERARGPSRPLGAAARGPRPGGRGDRGGPALRQPAATALAPRRAGRRGARRLDPRGLDCGRDLRLREPRRARVSGPRTASCWSVGSATTSRSGTASTTASARRSRGRSCGPC